MSTVYQNFYMNTFHNLPTASILPVVNPADESLVAEVQLADDVLVEKAVKAAATAQKSWAQLSSVQRGQYLENLAEALLDHSSSIAEALQRESGKTILESTNEVTYAADITRYHAQWARRIEGEVLPSDSPREMIFLQRIPIGVVTCLIPFNYPVYILLRKIAPALIAGNTVVVRASNHTPCCALEIARAVLAAKIPAGVINILVMDHPAAAVMCQHPSVGMITLTGGLEAGRKILEYSRANIAKTSLELGGKTPAIILNDADLSKAALEVVNSTTTHCGQLCTSVERAYVEENVYDEFVALLQVHMQTKKMGPLNSTEARESVHAKVLKAIEEGAKMLTGGKIPTGKGFFYPATLLVDCRQEMSIIAEEVFGPVLAVVKCRDAAEALKFANDHQYALASVCYTADHGKALEIANNIEAGEIYINRTPGEPYQGYHAGHKKSGLGGDDGKHGMLEFTQTRLVVMPY